MNVKKTAIPGMANRSWTIGATRKNLTAMSLLANPRPLVAGAPKSPIAKLNQIQ
jgi:hypothetical protein